VRQFLTPDNGDGVYLCRRLRFRAELAGFITGTLERMTHPSEWEEFGSMTPQEAADYSLEMFTGYLTGGDRCMIGDLWAGITADYPAGVLPFDGTQYLRTDYPTLYALIDAAFIDDADHFTLHEAAGRALVIAGTGTGLTARAVGDRFGDEAVTLSEAQLPAHHHTYTETVVSATVVLGELAGFSLSDDATSDTGDTGGDEAHPNVQPSFAVKVGVWAL
jgi:microcystin-dependent protein